MNKMIPECKMSKKAQKELAKKRRTLWEVNPVSRKVESKKHYDRNSKRSRAAMNDSTGSFLFS